MATPRTPQDRLPKREAAEKIEPHPELPFTFTGPDGETYQLAATEDILDAGFARRNRNKTPEDQLFTMLEALADDDALAAIDSMKKHEFLQFQRDFYAHTGAELGE